MERWMTTPAEIYTNGIKKKLKNYWAAWLPISKFELGDIGVLKGKIFERIHSLNEFGIKYDIIKNEDASPIDYVSESGVSINIKLSGETNSTITNIPLAKAGIGINFSSKGAFIIEAEKTYEDSMKSMLQLQEQIIPKFKEGHWDKNWVVIVKIVKTPVASILISNSSNSIIELESEVSISNGLTELGKIDGKLSMKLQEGDIFKTIGAKNLTPFFQIAKIKRRLFRPDSFATKSFAPQSDSLEHITPDLVKKDQDIEKFIIL